MTNGSDQSAVLPSAPSILRPKAAWARPMPRIRIGQAMVDAYTFDEAAEAIVHAAREGGEPKYVVTPNAQHIVLLESDEYLRQIYSEAAFALPDGASLLLGARIMGKKFSERVAGVDMFQALCRLAARDGLRVFLLGGRPRSAERAAEILTAENPALEIAGICCPDLGFEKSAEQQLAVVSQIQKVRPDLLFVALGAPKQEYWMYENRLVLGVPMAMGVGGSFEMVSGTVARAPMALQRMGLEWLHRLWCEPSRMWKRYLIGNLQFMSIVLRQRLGW